MAAPMKVVRQVMLWSRNSLARNISASFNSSLSGSNKDDSSGPKNDDHIEQTNDSNEDKQVYSSKDVQGLLNEKDPAQSAIKKAFDVFKKAESTDDKHGEKSYDGGLQEPFETLLKKSKLMEIGDPDGRIVIGKIIEIVEDDMYIDFGGKFHCVCKTPRARASEYVRGAEVKLRLRDLELASRFLGAKRDVTLLEAEATLIGLVSSKAKIRNV